VGGEWGRGVGVWGRGGGGRVCEEKYRAIFRAGTFLNCRTTGWLSSQTFLQLL